MAALLTSISGVTEKVAFYVDACRQMGIEILPPDVNESLEDFTVVGDRIRFGLNAVKNVGTVSYTHLDVYKRQPYNRPRLNPGER